MFVRPKAAGWLLSPAVVPLILKKDVPDVFSADDSHFKMDKKHHKSTARAAGVDLGILHSFTVESSFCGTAEYHFSSEQLQRMGENLARLPIRLYYPDVDYLPPIIAEAISRKEAEELARELEEQRERERKQQEALEAQKQAEAEAAAIAAEKKAAAMKKRRLGSITFRKKSGSTSARASRRSHLAESTLAIERDCPPTSSDSEHSSDSDMDVVWSEKSSSKSRKPKGKIIHKRTNTPSLSKGNSRNSTTKSQQRCRMSLAKGKLGPLLAPPSNTKGIDNSAIASSREPVPSSLFVGAELRHSEAFLPHSARQPQQQQQQQQQHQQQFHQINSSSDVSPATSTSNLTTRMQRRQERDSSRNSSNIGSKMLNAHHHLTNSGLVNSGSNKTVGNPIMHPHPHSPSPLRGAASRRTPRPSSPANPTASILPASPRPPRKSVSRSSYSTYQVQHSEVQHRPLTGHSIILNHHTSSNSDNAYFPVLHSNNSNSNAASNTNSNTKRSSSKTTKRRRAFKDSSVLEQPTDLKPPLSARPSKVDVGAVASLSKTGTPLSPPTGFLMPPADSPRILEDSSHQPPSSSHTTTTTTTTTRDSSHNKKVRSSSSSTHKTKTKRKKTKSKSHEKEKKKRTKRKKDRS
eukprot:TRINITY_DN2849_c1_g2_i1.p1 TRINITY_DN2849_c1_g2~~TRINITY_DN2849_c1_g2_i1.p1  ORF type:complete len:738 (+),score=247.10 TRINITY_DN2849_c1_g2_i1:313-2214(+)